MKRTVEIIEKHLLNMIQELKKHVSPSQISNKITAEETQEVTLEKEIEYRDNFF